MEKLVKVINKEGKYTYLEEGYYGFMGYILYNCDCEDSYSCDCDGEELLMHVFFDKDKVFKGIVIDEHSCDYIDYLPDIISEQEGNSVLRIDDHPALIHRYIENGKVIEKTIEVVDQD